MTIIILTQLNWKTEKSPWNKRAVWQVEPVRFNSLHLPPISLLRYKKYYCKRVTKQKELNTIEQQKPHYAHKQLFTIGYEGISLETYINKLIINDVNVLCDVRKNAYSQKYGFSKQTLELACKVLTSNTFTFHLLALFPLKDKICKRKQIMITFSKNTGNNSNRK